MYGSVLDRIGGDHSSEERVRILERRLTRQGNEGQQYPAIGLHDISPSVQLQRYMSTGIHLEGDVRTSDSTAAEQSVPRMSADAEAQLHLWSNKRLKVQGSEDPLVMQAKLAPSLSPFVTVTQQEDSGSDIISPPHALLIPMLEAPGLQAAPTPTSTTAPMLPRTLFQNAGPAPSQLGPDASAPPASHPTHAAAAAAAAAAAVGSRVTKGVKATSKSGVTTSSRAAPANASSMAATTATAAATAATGSAASAAAANNAAASAAAAAAASNAVRSNTTSSAAANGSTKNAASKRKRRSPAPSARPTLHQMSPEGTSASEQPYPAADRDAGLRATPVRNLFDPNHKSGGLTLPPRPSTQKTMLNYFATVDGNSRESYPRENSCSLSGGSAPPPGCAGGAGEAGAGVGSHAVATAAALAATAGLPQQLQQQQLQQGQQQQGYQQQGGNGTCGGGTVSQDSACTAMLAVACQRLTAVQALLDAKSLELIAAGERMRQGAASEAALQGRVDSGLADAASLREMAQHLQNRLSDSSRAAAERETRLRGELTKAVQVGCRAEKEVAKMGAAQASPRLGCISLQRRGPMQIVEVFEEGPAFKSLRGRQTALVARREEVERERKALRKRLAPPPSGKSIAAAAAAASAANPSTPLPDHSTTSSHAASSDTSPGSAAAAAAAAAAGGSQPDGNGWGGSSSLPGASGSNSTSQPQGDYVSGAEYIIMEDLYKTKLASLKREEESLKGEEEWLNIEKTKLIRTLKLIHEEDGSRFNNCPVMAGCDGRFVLTTLLGRGGFSEVYKAYDLTELQTVSVKIHQVNSAWNQAKKESYVKHALREYDIHKGLRHPNIVGLIAVLEIDPNAFATVLEYCEGGDLDTVLKEQKALPEKEARCLLAQIISGLVYLKSKRIIHYDLKPANILFDSMGQAKITDFGLSKVVEEGHTMGMELTSQGAGTYWYLPPECFETGVGEMAPHITDKVDVWSAGVIFYQMLFGRRPFGDNLTQEQIFRDGVMLRAHEVLFPTKPPYPVSAEAKAFIRRCCTHAPEARWDTIAASQDPYLTIRK